MSKRRPPDTYEDLVRAFADLFDETEPQTPEDVDTFLREAGYDPDQVGARIQTLAEHALANSPLNWRNRALQELAQARAQLDDFVATTPRSRSEIIAALRQIIAQLGAEKCKLPAASFRNLERATDEDLASLLVELEYLSADQARPMNATEEQ